MRIAGVTWPPTRTSETPEIWLMLLSEDVLGGVVDINNRRDV